MCGIFGAVARRPGVELVDKVYFIGSQLQHRGQESCGMAYSDGQNVWIEKDEGLISQVFVKEVINEVKNRQPGMIIGQTRYSTSKGTSSRNIPPQWMDTLWGRRLALIHNGNLPDLEAKKEDLRKRGVDIPEIANDTELMLKKIIFLAEEHGRDLFKAISAFTMSTTGSYSGALVSKDGVYLFRDQWGNRPLWIAETEEAWFFASETCALKDLEVYIKMVGPGQILNFPFLSSTYPETKILPSKQSAHCVLEKIYFARPDSSTFQKHKQEGSFRMECGRALARLYPVPGADLVSGIPESGRPAAEGFALESGLPNISIYIRNPYILGRTFINPNPGDRQRYSEMKYHLMKGILKEEAKNGVVVLVDDTIMRGITLRGKIAQLYKAGMKEVHLRIAAPPAISPCYYGIDIPTKEELVASSRTVEQVREYLGATSLEYLPVEVLRKIIREQDGNAEHFCYACFTGDYPIPIGFNC